MQQKIKLTADSASDIPSSELEALDIDLLSVPITIEGKGYFERRSFTMEQFYDVIAGAKEIPATSRVPLQDYYRCFERAWQQGYTDIINVTINAGGSGTNNSAQMAREAFYAEHPETRETFRIHIVDSGTYAMAFGWPTVQAARMAMAGKSAQYILRWLEEYFSCVEIYLGVYTLDYAKKSGRIGAAAAFVGDVLGLRPIIAMIAGNTKTVAKVRGDHAVGPKLLELYRENCADTAYPALVVCGQDKQYGQELCNLLEAETGHRPPIYTAGASIVINAGPRLLAIVCKGKKRG